MIPYQSNIYCDILACCLTEQLSNSQSVGDYTIKLSESPEGGSDLQVHFPNEVRYKLPFSLTKYLEIPVLIFRKQLPFSVAFKKLPFAVMKDMKIPIPCTENEQIPVPIFTSSAP